MVACFGKYNNRLIRRGLEVFRQSKSAFVLFGITETLFRGSAGTKTHDVTTPVLAQY